MIISISPALAGPLAVAIANLRKQYEPPSPQVRSDLAALQAELQLRATGGHCEATFDANAFAAQAQSMRPLLVTFETAGKLLACSVRSVKRLVADGLLMRVGCGPGARVTVASIEDYVARVAGLQTAEETR